MTLSRSNGPATPERPNVLLICTDQQHSRMMSCAGNRWLKTPAMDSLAATGVRFTSAYCTNPVCIPSRASLFSGVMPSELNMANSDMSKAHATPEMLAAGAGNIMAAAGYEVAYCGKQHLPDCLPMADIGFANIISTDERDAGADASAAFIRQAHTRPWFLVTSLINPHDICYAAIREHAVSEFEQMLMRTGALEVATLERALRLPEGVDEETFYRELCPPLPENHEPLADEPERLTRYFHRRPFHAWVREHWTERDWRRYRWAYHRLTEMVDAQIARVLAALRESGQAENTVVILTSDHGDNDTARKAEHKTLPYQEASCVPMIVSQPRRTRAGETDGRLVSNGLDLIPTLCDYAGVSVPAHLRGHSVRALAEGRPVADWRQALVVESEVGRAIRDERYKYIVFTDGARRFQLFDLVADPSERVNLVDRPEFRPARERLHCELARRIREIGDPFGSAYVAEA